MDVEQFMQGYKKAWEERDEAQFCALFAPDGEYHNTPFAVQRGHAELAAYWQRVKMQEDVQVRYEILASAPAGGIAHWHVSYQVASEELFRIWAQSTGTNLVARCRSRISLPCGVEASSARKASRIFFCRAGAMFACTDQV